MPKPKPRPSTKLLGPPQHPPPQKEFIIGIPNPKPIIGGKPKDILQNLGIQHIIFLLIPVPNHVKSLFKKKLTY